MFSLYNWRRITINRLKELRKEKKWTQKYLAHLLNVKNTTLSKYETGQASLSEEIIIDATKVFNVTADFLLGISRFQDNISLTEDEKKVLLYYNRLKEEFKDSAKGHMVNLYREQQNVSIGNIKKENIMCIARAVLFMLNFRLFGKSNGYITE
jgi:transcriptional regulator with XRE-family HTH domain